MTSSIECASIDRINKMRPRLQPILVLCLGLLDGQLSWAQEFIVDQSHTNFVPFVDESNIAYGPILEFIPSLSSLNAVQLFTRDLIPSVGATLSVNIRKDSVTGPIIGTSDSLNLPIGFRGVTQFTFPQMIPLIPGSVYAIEPRNLGGDVWSTYENSSLYSGYTKGRMFFNGDENHYGYDRDFWFVEGVLIPEPSACALGALALLLFSARAGCRWYLDQNRSNSLHLTPTDAARVTRKRNLAKREPGTIRLARVDESTN